MAHFLSGCDYKKFFLMLLVTMLLFVSLESRASAAGCNCWWPDFYLISQSKLEDVDDPQVESDGNIDSCTFAGEQPGEAECQVQGGKGTVTEWGVLGDLNWKMINQVLGAGITANVGGTSTKSFGSSAKTIIDSWCKTCHAEAGFRYQMITLKVGCKRCPAWSVIGTYLRYKDQYSKSLPGSQPVPPCNPNCPSGA